MEFRKDKNNITGLSISHPLEVLLTVDMEQDCPPYMNSYKGIEQGTQRLLKLFDSENIKATFFFTGTVARKFPEKVYQVILAGHELGCHGDTHRVFSHISRSEAEKEIQKSSHTLRQFDEVISFRAPNLSFPEKFLPILSEHGYRIDSSLAMYKLSYLFRSSKSLQLRIPVSVTSSVLRLPGWLRYPYLSLFDSPIVLFVHPWEFVDLRHENLRLDCRFKTGDIALNCLKEVIHFFKEKNTNFMRLKDYGLLQNTP